MGMWTVKPISEVIPAYGRFCPFLGYLCLFLSEVFLPAKKVIICASS